MTHPTKVGDIVRWNPEFDGFHEEWGPRNAALIVYKAWPDTHVSGNIAVNVCDFDGVVVHSASGRFTHNWFIVDPFLTAAHNAKTSLRSSR